MLEHGGVRSGLQPRQRARLTLLHHGPFDRIHSNFKTASGFSHGLTLSHRSHQSFFQVGRIGTHISLSYTIYACHCFSQVALDAGRPAATGSAGMGDWRAGAA